MKTVPQWVEVLVLEHKEGRLASKVAAVILCAHTLVDLCLLAAVFQLLWQLLLRTTNVWPVRLPDTVLE